MQRLFIFYTFIYIYFFIYVYNVVSLILLKSCCMCGMFFRTMAELEYLEVDQYIWSILKDVTTSNSTEVLLEVSPDQIMASVAADHCQQQKTGLHFCLLIRLRGAPYSSFSCNWKSTCHLPAIYAITQCYLAPNTGECATP